MKTLVGRQNPLIKHLVKLKEDSSYRKQCGRLLLEGKKIVSEALERKIVKNLFLREGLSSPEEGFYVSEPIIKKLSDCRTSEGFFAEAEIPPEGDLSRAEKLLCADNVKDPGNMGTLLRTALAFGFEGLILLGEKGVDPFHPKVIRSSMGASLRLPIQKMSYEEFSLFLRQGRQAYVADRSGEPPEKITLQTPFVLILGNESTGSALPYEKVSLPMKDFDSLNVAIAGSILMYLWKDR